MIRWLEERLGFKTALDSFLRDPLPERVGWPHVLGSILLALLFLQILTGVLLSFVYAPSPLSAWPSVRYLMNEMPSGAWLRSIHYWAASAMVVVAVLHLIRTFVYAAYRPPRELTWIVGVLLLLVILAFGQTGYLLPWDQRSYWGTAVTIEIVETVPWIGPKLGYFLRGGQTVGALTLSRFYSIHVVILPILILGLVGFHLFLVRKFGITAPWSRTGEERVRKIPFYPYQMSKDLLAAFLVVGLMFLLALWIDAPLGNPADPADTTFVPRPDWYFLFLFQILHYFEGEWEIMGTFILPSLILFFLLALPFLDRTPRRELRYRPLVFPVLIGGISLWAYLTYEAVSSVPQQAQHPPRGMSAPRAERIKRPAEVGGLYLLRQYCFECHSMTVLGDRPSLQELVRGQFPAGREWLENHLQKEQPSVTFTEKETIELLSVLRLVAGDQPELLFTIPNEARFGAHFFYSKACVQCHRIDGQGGHQPEVPSPDLTHRLLRSKEWHMQHIRDPRSLVRKSKMPPFLHYEPHEYSALAAYILYLHTP